MTEANVFQLSQPGTFNDPLTAALRNGARTLLAPGSPGEARSLARQSCTRAPDPAEPRPALLGA